MSVASDLLRGNTDTILLAHLAQKDSYGYKINKAIQEKTKGRYELKEATLYTAFRRLEENGCIASYWGDENTGARRRYYSITSLGIQVLADKKADWNMAKEMIDKLIQEGGTSDA